ncbi:MAG: CDGSH iron-sulfur domain-containing protein [Thermoguttaceae bacterium]|nr:CDGSH iron-sulfur domain-containing protein [Thermoguttaceae bacterium]
MAEVVIRVRANGPYLVEGPVRVVDAQGNAFAFNPEKPVALCRCGQSSKKPFCDGAHRTCDFAAAELAPTG